MSNITAVLPCCCISDPDPPAAPCCGVGSGPVPTPQRARVRWNGSITLIVTGCPCGCADYCDGCQRSGLCTAMSGVGTFSGTQAVGGFISEGDLVVIPNGDGVPGCTWHCAYDWNRLGSSPENRVEFLVTYPPGNCTPIIPCPPPCPQFPLQDCVPWQPASLLRYIGVVFQGVYPDCELNRWIVGVRPGFGGPSVTGLSIPGPCNNTYLPTGSQANAYGYFAGPTILRCATSDAILPGSMFGQYEPFDWNLALQEPEFCPGGQVILNPGTVTIEAL